MTAIRAIKVGYNENKSFSKNVETLFFIYPQASYLYKNI